MSKESILFSQQLVTVQLEHVRLFEKALRSRFDLTLTEYCLLRILDESGEGLTLAQIEEHFALRQGTILSALLALENRGLIDKQSHARDRRKMVSSLAPQARPIVSAASKLLYQLMKETFWRNIPSRELAIISRTSYLRSRRQYVPQDSEAMTKKIISVPSTSLLIGVKTLTNRWEDLAHEQGGISLNAYRLLALLESFGGLTPSEIASRLLLAKSRVSTAKEELLQRELIKEVPSQEDNRSKVLQGTRAGRQMAKKLNVRMEELTRDMYELVYDEDKNFLNAWHIRMYLEIEIAHAKIDAL